MADPAVQASSDRLSIEQAISQVIAKENLLLIEQERIRKGSASIGTTAKLEGEIASLTAKTKEATGTSNAFSRAIERAGDNSSRTSSSVRDNSGALSEMTTVASATVDQLIRFREEIQKISENRYDFVTNISAQIGGSSRLYAAAIKDVTDFNKEMSYYDDNNQERINNITAYYKNMDDLVGNSRAGLKGLSGAQAEFVGQLGIGNKAFASAQYAAREFYGLSSGFIKQDGKIVPDGFFRIQGVPIEDVFGSVEAAFQPLSDMLSDETLSLSIAEKMSDKQGADEMVNDVMRMSTAIKAFGMTSGEVTELVRTNYIMSGKSGTDYFNDVTKAAMLGEKAFGYSSQMIIQDITKMSNNFETFGYRTPEQLAKISAAAHDAHMSISDLQSVMGKFNTFESAAGAVGQLNSALGTNFDALELMTLKFEDPAQMIQRLRDGFMTAGKTFEDLPATYRTMITQQLGITTEALRGIMDGSVRDIDALSAKQEDVNSLYEKSGETEAEKRLAMDEAIKSRVKITGDMIDQAGDMVAQAERAANRFANTSNFYIERTAAIGDAINGVSSKVAEGLIPHMNSLIEKSANSYSKIIMGALETSQSQLIAQSVQLFEEMIDKIDQAYADFQKTHPDIDMKTKVGPTIENGVVTRPTPAKDLYVSPGGSTVVTANYGEMNQKSFAIDNRDALVAKPPPEPTPPPPTPSRAPIPALSDAVRASLVGVGTSLRIELDVGQLTDLVLRDIMMNKPNVFGGLG